MAYTREPNWTDADTDILKRLWSNGKSASEIAAVISLGARQYTRNAIIGRVHRLGLSARAPGKARKMMLPREPRKIKLSCVKVRKAAPKVRTPIAPEFDVVGVLFADLEKHHCRWPIGDPVRGYCGCNSEPGLPYCEGHAARAYEPVSGPRPVIGKSRDRVVNYAVGRETAAFLTEDA